MLCRLSWHAQDFNLDSYEKLEELVLNQVPKECDVYLRYEQSTSAFMLYCCLGLFHRSIFALLDFKLASVLFRCFSSVCAS